MLRRQAIFLILSGLLAAGPQQAAAGESLVLPFKCSVEGGSVRLAPAREQALAIAGARQERVVLACAQGRPVQCRTMIAHNFAVMCGGERVSWMRVAEAIGGRRASRVWREGEQLNITLREDDPDGAVASAAPCTPRQSGGLPEVAAPGGDKLVEPVVQQPCKMATARELQFVLPAGFAPVSHFGARIVAAAVAGGIAPDATAKVHRAPVLAAAARADSATLATRQQLLERTILTEPLADIDVAPAPRQDVAKDRDGRPNLVGQERAAGHVLRPGSSVSAGAAETTTSTPVQKPVAVKDAPHRVLSAWSATVTSKAASVSPDVDRTASFSLAMPEQVSTSHRDVMLWLILTSLFVTTGWMAWSRPQRFAVLARRVSGGVLEGLLEKAPGARLVSGTFSRIFGGLASLRPAGAQGDRSTSGGFPAAGLEAAIGGVYGVVGALPSDLPLRSVLDDEMQRVRQRLAVVKAASVNGQIPAPAFRVLMRDLERIRRIGESARDGVAASARGAAAGPASGQMPRNRAEALHLLGLNASVSEATVKKCVDALRMSWHPDLAHDAADLAKREERIKQINAAMDLICEKPQQD